jgi:hypothetical protein
MPTMPTVTMIERLNRFRIGYISPFIGILSRPYIRNLVSDPGY